MKSESLSLLPPESEIRDFLRPLAQKDIHVFYHSDRVSIYAELIARALGCSQDFITLLKCLCRFHDIGKYEIPTEILNKPGKLTLQEWQIMKCHTIIGREILMESKFFRSFREAEAMVYCLCCLHHEYADGSGYWGKTNGDIPLAAKICQVADIFDALTSKRPYKDGCEPFYAAEIILIGDERTRPEQFDPSVIEAFKLAWPHLLVSYANFTATGEKVATKLH